MFPTLWREIDKSKFSQSLRQVLIQKNYPSDHRLRQSVLVEQVYGRSDTRAKINLILETINRHLSKKTNSGGFTILDNTPTIEHIMPQVLDGTWKNELGQNWEQTYREFLNTLGNLTLVTQEWNSTLSNSAFILKKQKLAQHALLLNKDYFSQAISSWNETSIRARAEWLTDNMLEIWPAVGVPPVIQSMPSGKPKSLTIMGQSFTVSSWRDVAYYTSQCVAELVDDFDSIAKKFPAYFDRDKFKNACRMLPNGWWLYLNLSAASVKNFCRNLLAEADISEEDWVLEEE